MGGPEVTQELARFVGTVTYEQIPTQAREQAKKLIFDALGVGLLGSRTEAAKTIYDAMLRIGESNESSVWGTDRRASAYVATMVNASLIHQTELGEGVSRAVVHASSAVVPAALAVAERQRSSGRDLVRAVALGVEVLIRWGYTMASDPSRPESERLKGDSGVAMYHGWMTPAMLAPIGAGTSAVLLNDRPDLLQRMWHFAVNICPATSFAIIKDGASGKGSFLGIGAATGVLAADLTAGGLTGIEDVFQNWMRPLIPTFDPARMTADLGRNWEIDFVLYKHFATIGPLFAPLEAVFGILEMAPDLDNDAIERIEVEGYGRSITIPRYDAPTTSEGARNNLPYCLAEALIRRRRDVFLLEAFRPEEFTDTRTLALARTVTAKVDPEFDELYPHRAAKARVRITLRDGRKLEHVADRDAISRYHHPTWDELTEKFENAAKGRVTPGAAGAIASAVRAIESLSDAREFTKLLKNG